MYLCKKFIAICIKDLFTLIKINVWNNILCTNVHTNRQSPFFYLSIHNTLIRKQRTLSEITNCVKIIEQCRNQEKLIIMIQFATKILVSILKCDSFKRNFSHIS